MLPVALRALRSRSGLFNQPVAKAREASPARRVLPTDPGNGPAALHRLMRLGAQGLAGGSATSDVVLAAEGLGGEVADGGRRPVGLAPRRSLN